MHKTSQLERFPMPLLLTVLAVGLTALAWYALGNEALMLVGMAFPLPLFVLWLSWGKTEQPTGHALEADARVSPIVERPTLKPISHAA